jgi:MFS family permease
MQAPTSAAAGAAVAPEKVAVRAASAAAWYALGVLTVVTLFAVVDRQVMSLLSEPIKNALSLSDLQLGLLQGTGVAVFAGLASFPLAWLADRLDRRLVLAGCVLVWSAAVMACGLSLDFTQLFLASAMVGAGEAGLSPIVLSMIPDLFREKQRQLANSVYGLATSAGGSLAMIVTGQMIAAVEVVRSSLPAALAGQDGWRLSFFAAALPAPLMMLLIGSISLRRRAGRPSLVVEQGSLPPASVAERSELVAYLRKHRATFTGFYLGNALSACGFAAISSWLVVISMRMFAQTPAQVGAAMGTVSLLALPIGFALSIAVSRLWTARFGVALPIRAIWIATFVSACLLATLAFATTATHVYVVAFFIFVTLVAGGMMYPTAMQAMAPASIRARTLALQLLLGAAFPAIAPPLVGFVSDQMPGRPDGLLLAAVAVAVPCVVMGAFMLRYCEKHFASTAVDAARIDAERTAAQSASNSLQTS